MKRLHCTFLIISIFAISLILCLLRIDNSHNWGGDFSLYIYQAKSIVTGSIDELALRNGYIVENSSVHTFSPVLYPWGFPLLLSPVYAVFGVNYIVFKVTEALFLIGALVMMFRTFRSNNRLPAQFGILLICIIAFNEVYIKATSNVLSEIPYLCFSYIGLYSIQKFLEHGTKHSRIIPIYLGCVLFFCFSIRTEGAGLFIALFAGQVQYFMKFWGNLKYQLFDNTLPYLTAIAIYFLTKLIFPTGFTSHFGYENLVNLETSLTNIIKYTEWLRIHMFGIEFPYFIYFILAIAVVGIVCRARKDIVLLTYFLFLVGLFVIWPFRELRYLYSIYPLLLYFVVHGLLFFYWMSHKRIEVKYVGFGILLLCLITNITNTAKLTAQSVHRKEHMSNGPESPKSKEMFSYIKKNTNSEDIIAFFKPRVMHLYTDRISLALFNNIQELHKKADYYVETKRVGNYFQIPLENNIRKPSTNLEKIFSNSEFNIYKILK